MSVQKPMFDFKVYDALMQNAGPGLKLILVKQLLQDVTDSARHYDHPLAKDLQDALVEIEGLRSMWKAIAADANRLKKAA